MKTYKIPNGKSILMDIGASTAKVLEVSYMSGKVGVFNSAVLPTNRYVSEHGIENLEELVESIVLALEHNEIRTKRIILASSILGMETRIEQQEKEQEEKLQVPGKIYGEQGYQSGTGEDQIFCSLCSEGMVYPIHALVEAFAQKGYQVVCVEDTWSAHANLMKMTGYTFDYPGNIILDVGQKTTMIGVRKGIPVFLRTYENRMSDLIAALVESLKLPQEKVEELFAEIGVMDTPENRFRLTNHGIQPDSYFECTSDFCGQYFKLLKEYLDGECDAFRLGRCTITLTGGALDVPGIQELFDTAFQDPAFLIRRSSLARQIQGDYLTIENRTGKTGEIGCIYGACIGLLYKNTCGQSSNLLPNTSRKMDRFVVSIGKGFLFGSVTVASLAACVTMAALFRSMTIPKVDSGEVVATESQLNWLVQKEEDFNRQLAVIQSVDSTGLKLTEYLSEYKDEMLTVVSIDTSDMLKEKDTSKQDKVKIENSSEESISEDSVPEETKAAQKYIVRGYSVTSNAISKLYTELLEQGFGYNTAVYGVEKTVLPSGETMYAFEIHVESTVKGGEGKNE